MTRIRLRPAGFDARPERPSSLRARAQRAFRAAAKRDDRNAAPCDSSATAQPMTALTLQVRALYEAGVVPVREIARLAGVAERTIYKYARKGGWRRRHGTQDIASAVRRRAALRKPRACVTAKGAGGRFIRGEDAGKPFARGLKAHDPAGETPALARAGRAALLADEAMARTTALRAALSDARMMASIAGAARDLAAIEDADDPATAKEPPQPRRARRKEWRAIGERPLWADRR